MYKVFIIYSHKSIKIIETYSSCIEFISLTLRFESIRLKHTYKLLTIIIIPVIFRNCSSHPHIQFPVAAARVCDEASFRHVLEYFCIYCVIVPSFSYRKNRYKTRPTKDERLRFCDGVSGHVAILLCFAKFCMYEK